MRDRINKLETSRDAEIQGINTQTDSYSAQIHEK